MVGNKKQRDLIFLILLILVPLIAAFWTFRDYGESVDESSNYQYADESLGAYHALFTKDFNPNPGKGIIHYYGPAFLMGADLFSRLLNSLSNGTLGTAAWHLAYFLTFQVGVVGLYLLAKRWFSAPAAIGAALLFLFQPLLWGHAFVNPKDIPFMTFFILTILAGLYMRDKLWPVPVELEHPNPTLILREWRLSKVSIRTAAILFLVLALTVLGFIIFGQSALTRIVSVITSAIFASKPDSLWFKALVVMAPYYNQLPQESYVSKAVNLATGTLAVLCLVFFLLSLVLIRRIFVTTLSSINNRALLGVCKDVIGFLGNPVVLLAGITLGLTTSIRVLGPFAGLIVLLMMVRAGKRQALSPVLAYLIVASIVIYLSWPYLWVDPINRFRSSLTIMSDFPWDGKILFNGAFYPSSQLPLSYIPTLFGVQFTEPVVALFILGLCWLTYQISRMRSNPEYAFLIILWGIIPFVAFTFLRTSLYDNFRQILFIVPPLFLLAGLALEKLLSYLRKSYLQVIMVIVLLLVGLIQIVHLHPYEYVYYNMFTGGLRGAYRQFEGDYLGTSSREAILFLNKVAPLYSQVFVYTAGNLDSVSRIARADLSVDSANHAETNSSSEYVIVSTRGDRDLKKYTNWKILDTIGRDGNIFAFVKQGP